MFDEGDPIAPHLRVGTVHTMDKEQAPIIGQFASPKTPSEFVAAIAKFNGPMIIVDSHGGHEDGDKPGGLMIGGESFDVWTIMGKVQMPPVVVLSACDTHPFDRSHATVANGFLACGALAVVATALPIRSAQASRFVTRLINRAVHYGEIVNEAGRSVPWTHIVSGVLRMELVTDIIRGFQSDGLYGEEKVGELLLATLIDLNPLRDDWFERLADRVTSTGKFAREKWDRDVADLIARSDAIRYLHLGNPESILIAGPGVAHRMQEVAQQRESSREFAE
jgi:hypothetical protein